MFLLQNCFSQLLSLSLSLLKVLLTVYHKKHNATYLVIGLSLDKCKENETNSSQKYSRQQQ